MYVTPTGSEPIIASEDYRADLIPAPATLTALDGVFVRTQRPNMVEDLTPSTAAESFDTAQLTGSSGSDRSHSQHSQSTVFQTQTISLCINPIKVLMWKIFCNYRKKRNNLDFWVNWFFKVPKSVFCRVANFRSKNNWIIKTDELMCSSL